MMAVDTLREIQACYEAKRWIEETGYSLRRGWQRCHRGDWMLWWAAMAGADLKRVVRVACRCIRASGRLHDGEATALETVEAWAEGRDGVTTRGAARAALESEVTFLRDAVEAAALGDARDVANCANDVVVYVAPEGDQRDAFLRECATICRREWSTLPETEDTDRA